jgi:type IV secretory pathway TraG/TraD family ATPase VirD4
VDVTATAKKARQPGNDEALLALGALLLVIAAALLAVAALHLTGWWNGAGPDLPRNPAEVLLGVATKAIPWPTTTTVFLALEIAVLVALAVLVAVPVSRRRRRRSRVDIAAPHMGRGRDVAHLTEVGSRKAAAKLGVESPGLPLGYNVAGGSALYQDWEAVAVHIWGPRMGKTSAEAILAILAAPGFVLTTSNKRDSTDATREPRAAVGTVRVFDPMTIADEAPTWWWNPLSYIVREKSGRAVRSMKLAKIMVAAARPAGAKLDSYFDTAGPSLISQAMLAAALDGRPITAVYEWLTAPTDDEPAIILDRNGHRLQAKAYRNMVKTHPKQRDGVYGTAAELMSFLLDDEAMRWVCEEPGETRPHFDPAAFVRSTDTLYLLSREGEASTGPLVTALTVAVCEAAEDLAKTQPRGRLAVPGVVVLDEAANICRWWSLPDLYSHYGSRGLCIITFLQSWSQGVDVWGREGMAKLWSAANVKIVGGGVAEVGFLDDVSRLVGTFPMTEVSTSAGGGKRTTSRSVRRERILEVADLGAMPRWRAVLLTAGAPAVLLRTRPWWEGPHAEAVTRSIAQHDPAAPTTLSALPDSNTLDIETAEQLRRRWARAA